ncbi:HAD family hydrolase [Arcticibacter sp. MXS-1]|uniref:HAD family hydrolase n=1 Tax=Arcticibacter sp. MXS-1 TaxID=3341726 RepID=UPI0035A84462
MIKAVIFDLGGVLIDWNPRYLYRKIFRQEEDIDLFLERVCTPAWNEEQDGGRSLAEATETLIKEFPEQQEYIRAYYDRWEEMLKGPIGGTVELFKQIKDSGRFGVYALTNWSAETFPIAVQRYDFLSWFDGILVSGDEKLKKPAPEFYELLLSRYSLLAEESVFIDDSLRNVEAARKVGIRSVHFKSAAQLATELGPLLDMRF